MEKNLIPLSNEDTFFFACGPHVSCFNECCRDLNQFLTPYDILRLKNRLGISSMDFLQRYTISHTGPETGLPIVRLKENPADNHKCPFVGENGCSVYEDRPSSCRCYPIIRVASRNRLSGELSEHFALMKEHHCLGHEQRHRRTVREWIKSQQLGPYNEMNDLLMEIISLKNQRLPGRLDFLSGRYFHMACYDLDKFREEVFKNGLSDTLSSLGPAFVSEAGQNETALLKLAMEWLKLKLFGKNIGKETNGT